MIPYNLDAIHDSTMSPRLVEADSCQCCKRREEPREAEVPPDLVGQARSESVGG